MQVVPLETRAPEDTKRLSLRPDQEIAQKRPFHAGIKCLGSDCARRIFVGDDKSDRINDGFKSMQINMSI